MGDNADAMLDGTFCEGCGSFIDLEGGTGFPRYCSPQCARDRGAIVPRRVLKSRHLSVAEKRFRSRNHFVRPRRWLTAADQLEGVHKSNAPAYLEKLAARGFLFWDDKHTYFITDQGRVELERIARIAAAIRAQEPSK
jgi:hypothetical protein